MYATSQGSPINGFVFGHEWSGDGSCSSGDRSESLEADAYAKDLLGRRLNAGNASHGGIAFGR